MESSFPTVLAEIQKIENFLECCRTALAGTPITDYYFFQMQGMTMPTVIEAIYRQAVEIEAKTGRKPTTIQVSPDVYTRMEQEFSGKEPIELWGMNISIIDCLPQGYIALR
jgi:hypothetical protein